MKNNSKEGRKCCLYKLTLIIKMEEKEMNFEDSIKELENIADELEKGNLSLDESVSKFEQGMKLSKKCSDFLNSAEKKITMLINDDDNIKEENFVPTED